ncbi:hypothetical protein M9M90_03835 [Phenylobacterium sp. LH3H17]|uniref:hypothetical protein n=1 Tax=Phenylobacterium sp. LH3H17 TaxID=2903901 RepID=UPI0020C9E556|nr:hypothetical protein [Phenylobacterium sp. LH3H17]UTP40317.1 hypothetical protein M9M90_03835 [Phenylobacterium sp. LH3H17]
MSSELGVRTDYPIPAARRFRVYAFDPLASTSLDTALVNDAVISLPWEEPWEEPLGKGPSGEYLEVVDYDPASGLFYEPLDPTAAVLLAQDGLPPSESRPQFHQQMVYAVAMKTIRHFERALGRKVLWSRKRGEPRDGFVRKLRVHPHALRERNAYYSPDKKALLFGYFKASQTSAGLPDGWVFTCLSHDIIAHETTHAILDGVHRRFIEPTSLDTLAFHEAFADIVALLQHFTMAEAVEQQLAQVRGRLRTRNLLTGLAHQFGDATGRMGALREAIDIEPTGDGPGDKPPKRYADSEEPHERGSFLVAAIFDAFVTIFERRTADLMRLAQTTALGEELHPDMVKRLAAEAMKAADHLLRICVRALDYVPPIDIRFGEFLRAMITADADLIPDDKLHYRLAIAEAFRRRGIFPKGCLSMAPDSLLWETPDAWDPSLAGIYFGDLVPDLDLQTLYSREAIWDQAQKNQLAVWRWLTHTDEMTPEWERMLGIRLRPDAPMTIERSSQTGAPKVEVHSVRIARRAGPDGQDIRQLVVEITQTRRGFFDPEAQARADRGEGDPKARDFIFRGGATLLVDLRASLIRYDAVMKLSEGKIRYAVRKRIDDDRRLQAQRDYLRGGADRDLGFVYFGERDGQEPFAMLHRG